jgi:nucleoside phosphorylase
VARSTSSAKMRPSAPLDALYRRAWNARSMDIGEVKGQVDFGILTIREDEFRAFLRRFPDKLGDGRAQGRRIYNLRSLALPRGGAYTLAIVRCVEQGNGEALAMARDLLEDLAPRWLLVVGIAGAMPSSEITLGDVVVSTRILDFSVEALLEGGAFEHAVTGGPVHHDAAALAANLPALDDELGAWSSPDALGTPRPPVDLAPGNFYGDEAWQKKVRESLDLHFGTTPRAPRFSAGALASSDRLVKDTHRAKAWLLAARQILAVEMESGGVHRATYGRDVPFLAIRGLSDVVGFRRDPAWTQFACDVAAAFVRAFLLTKPIALCSTERDPSGADPALVPEARATRLSRATLRSNGSSPGLSEDRSISPEGPRSSRERTRSPRAALRWGLASALAAALGVAWLSRQPTGETTAAPDGGTDAAIVDAFVEVRTPEPTPGRCPDDMASIGSGRARVCIDRYEVTVKRYADYVNDTGHPWPGTPSVEDNDDRPPRCNSTANPARAQHPVNCVTFADADGFCRWDKKALPTREEWRLAGGRTMPGIDDICWSAREMQSGTCTVGRFGGTPEGVFDLYGNVWEIVADRDPNKGHLIVGGGWPNNGHADSPIHQHGYVRDGHSADFIGFRCVRRLGPGSTP